MRNETPWYSSITIGYSDSEDRLWVRLTGQPGEAMMWLTRRLMRGLIGSTFELMAGKRPRNDFSASHRELIAARADVPRTAAPPRASPEVSARQLGLLNAIDISVDDVRLSLTFKGAGGVAGFACDRPQAHQLLQAFWDRQSNAGWAIASPWAEDVPPADSQGHAPAAAKGPATS